MFVGGCEQVGKGDTRVFGEGLTQPFQFVFPCAGEGFLQHLDVYSAAGVVRAERRGSGVVLYASEGNHGAGNYVVIAAGILTGSTLILGINKNYWVLHFGSFPKLRRLPIYPNEGPNCVILCPASQDYRGYTYRNAICSLDFWFNSPSV